MATRLSTLLPPVSRLNLPSAITTGSALSGVAGLILAGRGHLPAAITLGLVAVLCDQLDGALARRLGLTTPFGAALDSLADAISFCVLPAGYLAWTACGPAAWGAALLFVTCGIWRLAHFDEAGLITYRGRPAFVGMPTPYAASLFWLVAIAGRTWPDLLGGSLLPATGVLLGVWMIVGLPFPKGGWHYRAMWLLLPAGAASVWWH